MEKSYSFFSDIFFTRRIWSIVPRFWKQPVYMLRTQTKKIDWIIHGLGSRVSGEIKREPRDVDRINLFPINQRALWKTQGAIATVEPADIYFRDIKPVSLSLRASLTSPIRSQTAQRRWEKAANVQTVYMQTTDPSRVLLGQEGVSLIYPLYDEVDADFSSGRRAGERSRMAMRFLSRSRRPKDVKLVSTRVSFNFTRIHAQIPLISSTGRR